MVADKMACYPVMVRDGRIFIRLICCCPRPCSRPERSVKYTYLQPRYLSLVLLQFLRFLKLISTFQFQPFPYAQ